MKKILTAAMVGAVMTIAAPALAQEAAAPAAAAPAKLSAGDTPIADIAANPAGKTALDKVLPGLTSHEAYEQFKSMSLKQVQPMSQGAITDDQIKALQSELDQIK